jgi:hypothetical protein
MNVLGLRINRRVLILALLVFLAFKLVSRRGGGFPNFTLRQRSEP